ncbi:MAG: phage portal protein [Coriobacteriales bacterium]|jgi:hypothetical protein|nr:phage portal protein [Coriobacteriales bacterium]
MISGYSSIKAVSIAGLSDVELAMLKELLTVWDKKRSNNAIRAEYYSGHNRLKDLGISIPPRMRNTRAVVGWPAKAVDALAARSRFEGFTFATAPEDDVLAAIVKANNFRNAYSQAVKSELIHSCAFITVSAGRKSAGEPSVLLNAYSALNAAAIWDPRRKRIKCGLTIVETEEKNAKKPTALNLYTDGAVLECARGDSGKWTAHRVAHTHGRPLIEPLVYRPSLDRPFGKSRISKAVMGLTDSAVRQSVRCEVSAEFFTSPQRYLLGANEEDFDRDRWESYIGALFLASRDESENIPQYGQLPQGTMQPHIDYMRSLASQFAGETNIPVSYLGIIHDNPASAEAIYAASEELVIEASDLNDTNGAALRNVALLALAIHQGRPLGRLEGNDLTVMPRFLNPGRPSIVSQSDAMVKQISAMPWMSGTTVALEQFGYTEEEKLRLLAEKRRAEAAQALAARGLGMAPLPTIEAGDDAVS